MPSPQRLLAASCVLAQIALAAHAQAQHIHQPLHAALHHRDLISLPDSSDKTTAGGAGADTTAATTAATTANTAATNTQATTAPTTHTTATQATNTQVTTTSPTTQQTTTQPTSTPTTTQPTTANTNTNTNTSPPATTANTSQTNNNNQQTSSPTGQASKSASNNNNNNNASPSPAAPITSQAVTVNADGQTQTIVTVITPTVSAASSAASSSSTSSGSGGGSSGLGGGSIAGMVIAGIVGVSGIVGFLVWKLKRKRFSDFDDNEAIKWPDLNGHGQANDEILPVGRDKSTFGGSSAAGSTAHANDSEFVVGGGAARMDGYAPSIAASTPDVHDPYAVPPLPHMNPGQPAAYHDDPYAPGGYDPYRGPVPGTLDDDAASIHHPEAYQMTQIRARSPAPGGMMAPPYPGGGPPSGMPARVASPGPGQVMAYGDAAGMRSRSPAPTLGGYGGGRSSPAPGAYYNGMR